MFILLLCNSAVESASAQDEAARSDASRSTDGLSAKQVFEIAENARVQKNFAFAEKAYRALIRDPQLEIRTEARFRLGMMLADELHRYADAAIAFREILDDKPNAARVRLELARMRTLLGDMEAARKEFRAAEAAGLPPEVEQLVRFYSRYLDQDRTFGGTFELALAPDTNINRATRSNTVGTIIGDFVLDEDAKAKSGIGLNVQGQGFVRLPVHPEIDLLLRAGGSAALYRQSEFNDTSLSLMVGPQIESDEHQLTLSLGPTWRWFGQKPFSTSLGVAGRWQRAAGKRGQLRIEGGVAHITNHRNDLQNGHAFNLAVGLDRAFNGRMGGGVQIFGSREAALNPGYSLKSGGGSFYIFREMGSTTLVSTLAYSRLEADERLFIYPKRRSENRYSLSLAGTFRSVRIGKIAPLVRLRWERNQSTVEIFQYSRLSAEFGISSAF